MFVKVSHDKIKYVFFKDILFCSSCKQPHMISENDLLFTHSTHKVPQNHVPQETQIFVFTLRSPGKPFRPSVVCMPTKLPYIWKMSLYRSKGVPFQCSRGKVDGCILAKQGWTQVWWPYKMLNFCYTCVKMQNNDELNSLDADWAHLGEQSPQGILSTHRIYGQFCPYLSLLCHIAINW